MIGALVTGIIAFLFSIFMGILAVMFLNGKCLNLVAGYNDMSETEKNTAAKEYARMNGKSLMFTAVITLIYSILSIITAFELLSKNIFVLSTVIYVLLFVLIVISSVIRFVKKNI